MAWSLHPKFNETHEGVFSLAHLLTMTRSSLLIEHVASGLVRYHVPMEGRGLFTRLCDGFLPADHQGFYLTCRRVDPLLELLVPRCGEHRMKELFQRIFPWQALGQGLRAGEVKRQQGDLFVCNIQEPGMCCRGVCKKEA